MMELKRAIELVGKPTERWPGNCYFCASKLHPHVEGSKLRYGCWTGPIVSGTLFDRGAPFAHHGWLELPDRTIIDPTRWVFEDREPYIYHGPNDHYDIGGRKLLGSKLQNRPAGGVDLRMFSLEGLEIEARAFLMALFDGDIDPQGLNLNQIFWLGNLDPDAMGVLAEPIYRWFERSGQKAIIPVDCWNFVFD